MVYVCGSLGKIRKRMEEIYVDKRRMAALKKVGVCNGYGVDSRDEGSV